MASQKTRLVLERALAGRRLGFLLLEESVVGAASCWSKRCR